MTSSAECPGLESDGLESDGLESEVGADLVAAVDRALPVWLWAALEQRAPVGALGSNRDELDAFIARTHLDTVQELGALLRVSFDQQTTSPLAVLRGVVGPLTGLLHRLGAEPVERDRAAVELHPGDVFDLTPGAFADFGIEVGEAGLRWGAAKAFVHLRARADRGGSER